MYFRNNKKHSKNVSINESIGFDKEGNEITILDILKTDNPDFIKDIHTKNNISLLNTPKNKSQVISFYLSNTNIISGENILHIEYKGNNTYRATKSAPFLVNRRNGFCQTTFFETPSFNTTIAFG